MKYFILSTSMYTRRQINRVEYQQLILLLLLLVPLMMTSHVCSTELSPQLLAPCRKAVKAILKRAYLFVKDEGAFEEKILQKRLHIKLCEVGVRIHTLSCIHTYVCTHLYMDRKNLHTDTFSTSTHLYRDMSVCTQYIQTWVHRYTYYCVNTLTATHIYTNNAWVSTVAHLIKRSLISLETRLMRSTFFYKEGSLS